MSRLRLILHPTDFSAASRPALAQAIASAKEQRSSLLVVHVLGPVIPTAYDIAADLYQNVTRAARDHAQRQLDALVAKARKAGARATGLLLDGTPVEQIVRAARARHAGLIVMGTHGRTGLARLFLGSVAQRVIGNAPCPVLTVRAGR